MLPNTNPALTEIIATAQHPIVLFVFSEGCENEPTKEQKEVEEIIKNSPHKVLYYTWCIAENLMPMPRTATALYFFLPANQTPVFWRTVNPHTNTSGNLTNDMETLNKMFTQKMSYEEARFTPEERNKIVEVENFLEKEKETLHTFPSNFQMTRNLAKEFWKLGKAAATGLPVLVPVEVGYNRLAICESCPKLQKESYRCSACGCFMKTKSQIAVSECPDGKWKSYV
jgi:hypothetical protein